MLTEEQKIKARAKCKRWRDKNKEADRARQKKWREENKEKDKERQKKWREENKEYNKEYYENNKEWIIPQKAERRKRPESRKLENDRAKRWRKENQDKYRVKCCNDNHRSRKNGGMLSETIVKRLKRIQKNQCTYCRNFIIASFEIDHKKPLSRGGKNIDTNIQLLCRGCNKKKRTKTHEEYLLQLLKGE